ncbi:MAG: 3-deoxy-8-phosphooctulonate synthase [Deltaproteobacteria bacterium]|nr:3-deoxy-8-phosphooctulonate synthase [Deltaproteobacteria bacterium]
MARTARIGAIEIGGGWPLALIAGLNVIEAEDETLDVARRVRDAAARHGFPFVFKASCDKANRSSLASYRGPGFDEGLRILARVKRELGVPVLTDVHEPPQAKQAAAVCDALQVPAFLCRQTDLLLACAATGLPVNVKKGQFMAPDDMRLAVAKIEAGGGAALVTERGTSFGYGDLVVDMRSLVRLRAFAPVCFDATHAVQRPGAAGDATGGEREMVAPLARGAVAVGIDALFLEVHPDPERAPCDGASQLGFEALEALLAQLRRLESARG